MILLGRQARGVAMKCSFDCSNLLHCGVISVLQPGLDGKVIPESLAGSCLLLCHTSELGCYGCCRRHPLPLMNLPCRPPMLPKSAGLTRSRTLGAFPPGRLAAR